MKNLEEYQEGNIVKCEGIDIQNPSVEEIVRILKTNINDEYLIETQGIRIKLIAQGNKLNPIYLNEENFEKLGFIIKNEMRYSEVLGLEAQIKYSNVSNKSLNLIYSGYKVLFIDENIVLEDDINLRTLHELQNVYEEYFDRKLDISNFYN